MERRLLGGAQWRLAGVALVAAGRQLLSLALVAGLVLTGCGSSGIASAPVPTASGGPTGALDGAGIRAQLAAALSARNLVLEDANVPFRPAEPPDLAAAPRVVYQVELRDDPSGGFIVAYQLANSELAAAAGRALAAYLSSGPGRVQSPLGTVHVIRQVGSTLLYYRWLPGAAKDPLTPGIQEALVGIGSGIPVAS